MQASSTVTIGSGASGSVARLPDLKAATALGRDATNEEGPMAVAVTRLELDASALRREAKRCRDAKAARRMLALALVLEGASREAAARHAGPRAS
jgi:hypothetical protein